MIFTLLLTNAVWAGPVEQIGFGARSMGRGSGGQALAEDVSAVFFNPAGLARIDNSEVMAGFGVYRMRFHDIPDVAWDTNQDGLIDDFDAPLVVSTQYGRADGMSVGVGRAIGSRFGLAVAGFIPLDRFLRIRSIEPAIPSWLMYENRPHRFDFSAGFGWEQLPGFYVGGAVEVLAKTHFQLDATLAAGASLPQEDEDLSSVVNEMSLDLHTMTMEMRTSFAPTASILWDIGQTISRMDGWRLAAAYRGASGIPVDVLIDIQANIELDETEELEKLTVAALLPVEVSLLEHYVPARLTAGVGFSPKERSQAYLDVVWTGWSDAVLNIATLGDASLEMAILGSDLEIADNNEHRIQLQNTLGVRTGVEVALPSWSGPGDLGRVDGSIRLGGGYEPSALVSQGENSRVLDSDRAWVSTGLGVLHHDPFGLVAGPVAWDLYAQYHLLAEGSLVVSENSDIAGRPLDGSDIPLGGY